MTSNTPTRGDGRSSSASSQGVAPALLQSQGSVRTPKRGPAALNPPGGSSAAPEDKNTDFLCPICFNLIDEAHITKCGHTFCFACISKAIESLGRCPKCNFVLATGEDSIIPNYLLNQLIGKHKAKLNFFELVKNRGETSTSDFEGAAGAAPDDLRYFVTSESQNLTLPDVNVILEVLTQRKHLLEAESCAAQNRLLHEFLRHLVQQKEEQKNQLVKEVTLIKHDIEEVENILKEVHSKCPTLEEVEKTVGGSEGNSKMTAIKKEMIELIDTIDSTMLNKGDPPKASERSLQLLATRRRKMHAHFDDLVQCYFASRSKDLFFGNPTRSKDQLQGAVDDKTSKAPPPADSTSGLDAFRENLVKFSRYNALRPLATLNYSSDLFNNSTIVSSIEFDKDNEFFAIAGVTKRIKVFDYETVIRDTVDIHYPCMEMVSSSKISCVSWNTYHKSTLASSDYEGTVTIWDASTGQRSKTFQEHEKRCWSVDFNEVDTRLIASGSDDARVKLWSLNCEHSVATLEAKANVCCVKFNPRSSCHLAFGSADHCTHYYDLRNMKEALAVFKGHKKAVSYVKFVNMEEIVSASTDSQLKMWNINSPHCLRSFVGHINEKNFVGLATDGDYVACGSENNALYVYYKGLTKKLFSYRFEAQRSVLLDDRREDDPNEFVSAVCWRQHSNVVVAANSQGTINILELY